MFKAQLLIFFSILISFSNNLPTYQIRNVYQNQQENVCTQDRPEFVKAKFQFGGFGEIEQDLITGTGCKFGLISNFWNLFAIGTFSTYIEDQEMLFFQKMIRTNPYRNEKQVLMNTTLGTKNMVYKSVEFNCQLEGDGEIQHFNARDRPITAILKIKCERHYSSE